MPRKAVDSAQSTVIGVNTHTVHVTGYDPGWTNQPGVNTSTTSWLRHPESVNNPVREDGTRALSAYSIDRYLSVTPAASISQQANGRWGYHTRESTRAAYCTDLVGNDARLNHQKVIPSDSFMTNVDAIARVNFLKKLEKASGKSQVELGVAAGEVRETINMASDLAGGLTRGVLTIARDVRLSPQLVGKALDSVRSLGIREAANRVLRGDVKLLERIVESWLVYQFGLKPLAYDLYDATVYLGAEQQKHGTLKLKIKVNSGFDSEAEELVFRAIRNGGNSATYNVDAKFLWYGKVHYSGWYEIPTRATIPEELGLYNPMLIGWELLRFSWLVDYVVDIGGWFRSMMAARGTRFVEGTRSELRQARFVEWVDAPDNGVTAGGPVASQLNRLRCSIAADSFRRTLLGPGGVMPPILPGVSNIMDLHRLANTMAALTTLVDSRQRTSPPIISYRRG